MLHMAGQRGGALPRIVFAVSKEDAKAAPRGASLIVATMVKQFGLTEIAEELDMGKHHGLSIEHVLLVFLLFSSYGATSVRDLQRKAQEDTSLAAILEGIGEIHEHVLRYFSKRHEETTLEQLLDRFVRESQRTGRFESREDGILAIDDSTIEKFGKHMDHIAVVYDHCDKRFHLGYVVVSTCYCDTTKGYPVNFEFRIQTEEEMRRAEESELKKKAGIDFRRKGALTEWLQELRKNDKLPETLSLVDGMVSVSNFKQADALKVPWVAGVDKDLPFRDIDGNHDWKLGDLKKKTLANKPDVSEVEGLKFYTKEVSLPDYDRELDFVVVTDFSDQEVDAVLLPKAPHLKRVERVLQFFEREGDPEASKLHIAVDLVDRAKREAKIKAATVAADSWYFVAWFVQALLRVPGIKRVVSKLKSHHQLLFSGAWMRADQLWQAAGLNFRHDRRQGFKWASLKVEVKELGVVRVVLVQELDQKRPWRIVAQYIVVCTDADWSPLKIVAAYKLRWGIEVFYRMAKQRFGLTQFHAENFSAIHFHMTFVFLAYLMTAVLRQMTPQLLGHTLGEVIDQYLRCLVSIKRKGDQLVVLLGPRFVHLFGVPTALAP